MVMYVVRTAYSYLSTTIKSVDVYHEPTANSYIILQLSETLVPSHVKDGFMPFVVSVYVLLHEE
jgi:hypothetical protein